MKEQIKIYKKRLRELGFRRKTDRVYWYDHNGLFYVVTFKMEGKDIDQPSQPPTGEHRCCGTPSSNMSAWETSKPIWSMSLPSILNVTT